MGSMVGDTALVDVPVFSPIQDYEVVVQFHRKAPRLATVTINECVPVTACQDLPAGTQFSVRRFF